MYIEKRSVLTSILLTIVTCGFYGIYWFVCMTDDAAKASGDNSMSGGKAFVFGILTCGIYYFYWAYKMGKMLQQAKIRNGIPSDDNSVLYVVLQVFGMGIVVYGLAQSELNKISDSTGGQGQMGNPYGQPPMGNPYGQPPMGNPYGQPPMGQPMGNQYGQPPMGQPMGNPYGQPPMDQNGPQNGSQPGNMQ